MPASKSRSAALCSPALGRTATSPAQLQFQEIKLSCHPGALRNSPTFSTMQSEVPFPLERQGGASLAGDCALEDIAGRPSFSFASAIGSPHA